MNLAQFYKGRRVYVTGHTGFKGVWLRRVLKHLGAKVSGYAFVPTPPLHREAAYVVERVMGLTCTLESHDVRNADLLNDNMTSSEPEVAFHLAGQAIVRTGYRYPAETFSINVAGTASFLNAIRHCHEIRSVIVVTTDKVYAPAPTPRCEDDPLGGTDPYSASKVCAETVVNSFRSSYFANGPAISTCRAGNAIGGGDFARDRIIPDCYRAVESGRSIAVRNPASVRAYQHVLEPLCAELLLAAEQFSDKTIAGAYNIGPDGGTRTADLVNLFCREWGEKARWHVGTDPKAPPEADTLTLDCTKIRRTLGWRPVWSTAEAVHKTVEWYKVWQKGGDFVRVMDSQIAEYLSDFRQEAH